MYSDLIFDYLSSVELEVSKDNGLSNSDFLQRIHKDKYEITTEKESKELGKPIGKYELISVPNILNLNDDEISNCIEEVSSSLKEFVGNIKSKDKILIVGLGNRHISSDSLGAKVVGGINVTLDNKLLPKVMAICPSVMGLTGIETFEIIKGVVDRIKPSHIILIDSLCASDMSRLGRSIQITNTGICPGGGIGNNRKCIGSDLAPNVYSIGVPLLIYAKTFIRSTFDKFEVNFDTISSIMHNIKKSNENSELFNILRNIKNILNDSLNNMIVSIKDIEECVSILGYIISSAINDALGVKM